MISHLWPSHCTPIYAYACVWSPVHSFSFVIVWMILCAVNVTVLVHMGQFFILEGYLSRTVAGHHTLQILLCKALETYFCRFSQSKESCTVWVVSISLHITITYDARIGNSVLYLLYMHRVCSVCVRLQEARIDYRTQTCEKSACQDVNNPQF